MPLFESYDRRIKQINEALAKYGIGSIEEAEQLCLSKGADAVFGQGFIDLLDAASAPLKKRNNSAFPRESTPVKL